VFECKKTEGRRSPDRIEGETAVRTTTPLLWEKGTTAGDGKSGFPRNGKKLSGHKLTGQGSTGDVIRKGGARKKGRWADGKEVPEITLEADFNWSKNDVRQRVRDDPVRESKGRTIAKRGPTGLAKRNQRVNQSTETKGAGCFAGPVVSPNAIADGALQKKKHRLEEKALP